MGAIVEIRVKNNCNYKSLVEMKLGLHGNLRVEKLHKFL